MSKYVIFREIHEVQPDGINVNVTLQFAHMTEQGVIETAYRSHATEYDTASLAYANAGRYPALADWRVGTR